MSGLSPSPYGSLSLYAWNHHRVIYALSIYKTQRPKKRNRNKFLFQKLIISRYLLREELDLYHLPSEMLHSDPLPLRNVAICAKIGEKQERTLICFADLRWNEIFCK